MCSTLYDLQFQMRLFGAEPKSPPNPPLPKGGTTSPFRKGGLRGISESSHLELQTVLLIVSLFPYDVQGRTVS